MSYIPQLIAKYNQPQRYYHNFAHIEQMVLDVFTLHSGSLTKAQMLAVLYHDAVYDPRHSDGTNERRSAEFFCNHYHQFHGPIDPELQESVCLMILATAKHGEDQPDISDEVGAVLDADLAVFARSPEQYVESVLNLYREFSPYYSLLEFLHGNSQFLRSLLRRVSIYYTEYAIQNWEVGASHNITSMLEFCDASIESLSGGDGMPPVIAEPYAGLQQLFNLKLTHSGVTDERKT